MSTWRFYLETFGCKVNQHESQLIREAWLGLGGQETADARDAAIICVNSCAITARAERDARNAIYRLKRLAPKARLILTGCAAQLYASGGQHADILKGVDWLVPQAEKMRLLAGPEAGCEVLRKKGALFTIHSFPRSRPIVKVQDGCRQNCSFCIVPQTRGAPQSRPFTDILNECHGLLEAGFTEIVISGINLRHYQDGRGNFWNMLRRLDSAFADNFAGQARFRISSLEPSMLDARALETIAACRMLAPHLHVSLQHASEKILKAMRRANTLPERLADFFQKLQVIWPLFGLGADIITGFPGENEADLRELATFLRETPFSYAHVFPYSPRPGTVAEKLPDQVPQLEKSRRAALIRGIMREKSRAFLLRQLNLPKFGLVLDRTDEKEAVLKGRNEYYAPCWLENAGYECKIVMVRPKGLIGDALAVELA